MGQGYYWSRPVAAEQLDLWLVDQCSLGRVRRTLVSPPG